MNKISYFNVIGPVMIGPSSSHTAGAVRIGRAARAIVGDGFNEVKFRLYGSFAKTYRGHGTDRALVAGVLNYRSDDERIKTAFNEADKAGLKFSFEEVHLVNAHPNTVIVEFTFPDGSIRSVRGVSTGGGQIEIVRIDKQEVRILPGDPSLILQYSDRRGVISKVTTVLADHDYNIEEITNNREDGLVTLVIIVDRKIDKSIFEEVCATGEYSHISYVYF